MEMHTARSLHSMHGIDARSRGQSRWLRRLLGTLSRVRSALHAELRARRDAAELASMDDRMLRDIGISRCEIDTVVRRSVLIIAGAQEAEFGWRGRHEHCRSD